MKKITQLELKALTSEDAGKILRDDGSLWAKVRATRKGISASFYYRFWWQGKTDDFACGSWPRLSLSDIRTARDKARLLVASGINPNVQKRATKIESRVAVNAQLSKAESQLTEMLTVSDLFDAWVEAGVVRKDGAKELRRMFKKDVLPAIGGKGVRSVSADDIRALLRAVVARGANRTAVMLLTDIKQMFRWGGDEQPWRKLLSDGDPAKRIRPETFVDEDYDLDNESDRILHDTELVELRDIFVRSETEYKNAADKRVAKRPVEKRTQLAIWIALSTTCRIGELLLAEWKHVDLDRGEWLIPRQNVKGRRGKKQEHLVLLSDFALTHFRALHELTGHTRWLFPARNKEEAHLNLKSVSKQIGDRQIMFMQRKKLNKRIHDNSLVLAKGENGNWTIHDMRRTGSTIMQSLGVDERHRDRCLNHSVGGKIRRVYGRYDFAEEKRAAWQLLGRKLERLFNAHLPPHPSPEPQEGAAKRHAVTETATAH